MIALTSRSDHRRVLAERLAKPPGATIIGLCAAWCDTCRQFRPSFERQEGVVTRLLAALARLANLPGSEPAAARSQDG